eukprot:5647648-Pleurochrysis_carterae.AAC.1
MLRLRAQRRRKTVEACRLLQRAAPGCGITKGCLAVSAIATDIYKKLNVELAGWVLHVLCFMLKKIIKHLGSVSAPHQDRRYAACATTERSNGFRRSVAGTLGYTEQAFRRVCVRADMLHGE